MPYTSALAAAECAEQDDAEARVARRASRSAASRRHAHYRGGDGR
ncbi:hypothetical protein V2J56_09275 [Georgenia sp. MJ206]